MAHKKAGGSSRNGRDSQSKRLGVKRYGGAGGARGQHHRAPARHEGPPRRQRRHGARTTRCSPRSPAKVEFGVKGADSNQVVSVIPVQ